MMAGHISDKYFNENRKFEVCELYMSKEFASGDIFSWRERGKIVAWKRT